MKNPKESLRQAQDDDVSLILFVICRGAYYAPAFFGKNKPFPYGVPPICVVILNEVKNPKESLQQAQDDDVSLILFVICRGAYYAPAFFGKSKPFPYGVPPICAVILNEVKNPKEILRQAQDDDVSLICLSFVGATIGRPLAPHPSPMRRGAGKEFLATCKKI